MSVRSKFSHLFVVKAYDPLGQKPARYRSSYGTWSEDPAHAVAWDSERAARDFISHYVAHYGPFTGRFRGMDLCVEVVA